MTSIDRAPFAFDPQRAVLQFKKGTTPLDAVEYLNVGREPWLDGTRWYLDTFVTGERSAVRFVKGVYGAGKTHMLYLTARLALERNFVVSYVTAEDAPLNRFDAVYRDLVSSLRTSSMVDRDGLDFNETTNGLKRILEDWFRATKVGAEQDAVDRHLEGARISTRVREAIASLDAERHWDANFRHAIQRYLHNLLTASAAADEQNETILRWLQGEALPKPEMRQFEVYESIKAANSRDMFRSLTRMLTELGYSGLVLLVDELERIIEQAPKARDKAYQTIRQLLDNADSAGTQSSYVLCAITPEVLTSQKGFKEYDALWERVKTEVSSSSQFIDKRAIVIDLELTPFDESELFEMARKVREIHASAFVWDAEGRVSDHVIKSYIDRLRQFELEISRPRVLIRTMAQILDRAEQHVDYDALADVNGEIADSVGALHAERDRDSWVW